MPSQSRSRIGASVFLVMLAVATACGGDGSSSADDRPSIVATTTVLGDVVRQVVGDRAIVTVLLPDGADPHDYRPSSRQAATLAGADLVVANGLGLEEGFVDVLDSARADGAPVVEIGTFVDPIRFADGGGDDPHIWLDPVRVAEAIPAIAPALDQVDPSVDWSASVARYVAELRDADEEIAAILSEVPAARRRLVTNHDALGYFADRYGFDVVGVIVPGGSTLGDPSSADLAELAAVIERESVPAIFVETTSPRDLADSLAAETTTSVAVVELYTGALGPPGGGADTLIGLLVTNARRIAEALS